MWSVQHNNVEFFSIVQIVLVQEKEKQFCEILGEPCVLKKNCLLFPTHVAYESQPLKSSFFPSTMSHLLLLPLKS